MKKIRTKARRGLLIRKADARWSLKVRTGAADKNGMVKCFTCDYVAPIKKMQCGHYISRAYKYTRWDPDNMRPQCYGCNVLARGKAHLFRENLVNEIGEDRVKALEARAKPLFVEKDSWIEEQIIRAFV